jgi:hypothetical protein
MKKDLDMHIRFDKETMRLLGQVQAALSCETKSQALRRLVVLKHKEIFDGLTSDVSSSRSKEHPVD